MKMTKFGPAFAGGGPVKEKGAVLVISLVMLLVITLLGVGSLETALFEERMATNAQNKTINFQVTANLLEELLEDDNVFGGSAAELNAAIVRGAGNAGTETDYTTNIANVSATYTITYVGEGSMFRSEGAESSEAQGRGRPRPRYEVVLNVRDAQTDTGHTHAYGVDLNL